MSDLTYSLHVCLCVFVRTRETEKRKINGGSGGEQEIVCARSIKVEICIILLDCATGSEKIVYIIFEGKQQILMWYEKHQPDTKIRVPIFQTI